ncbi:MAG: gamma carbonic anhydrase family protein [Planctomycetota bacterium]|nr:gamma carbonic anhydrase family protein [Planctomycetota bacterium]
MSNPLPHGWDAQAQAAPPKPAVPYPETHFAWASLHSRPVIDPTAWVAQNAVVFGRVKLGARSSVWYNCVLRGDNEYIEVGDDSNIQDGTVMHVDDGYPCIVGQRVTVGHGAVVHGCRVGDGALIAIGATILSRAVVGEGALIAAGALVLEGTQVPPHTLWAGVPAKQVKELEPRQRERLARTYRHYANNAASYLARFGRSHIEALLD